MTDWTGITFLESTENLKSRLKILTGRMPSTKIAKDVATCLQQGRLFYQAAEQSPLEIKPLLLFYGTMSFSKALITGCNLVSLSTLPQSHGLSDISDPNSLLSDLRARITTSGNFHRFNDTISSRHKFEYIDREYMTRYFMCSTDQSSNLLEKEISLKDILARIPSLSDLYEKTFNEKSQTENAFCSLSISRSNADWDIRLDSPEIYSDLTSLRLIIEEYRNRFPALKKLRVIEADRAWDRSIIIFANTTIPDNELEEPNFIPRENRLVASNIRDTLDFQNMFGSDQGSFENSRTIISPYAGAYFSKYSLHYLGMFLLSSLVRYRPQIWVHCLTRSTTQQRPADDKALSLVEAFMSNHAREMSAFVQNTLNPM